LKLIAVFFFIGLFSTRQSLAIDTALVATPLANQQAIPEEVRQVADEIQKSRTTINEKEQEKRHILGSLYEISKRMKKISQEKGAMTDKLIHTQGHVKFIARDIAILEKKAEAEKSQLGISLRNLYKISGETYLAILFSQESALSLDRTLKFFKIVSEKDFALIKTYQKNILELKTKKTNLNSQVQKLVHIELDIKKQESLLLSEHDQKSKIVTEIENKKLANVEKIKTLRTKAQSKNLSSFDAALSDLLKTAFYESKGQLPSPILGTVVQDFGLIKNEDYPTELSHKGWFYSSAKNASVNVVYEGRIVFLGSIRGYGATVIVDHGDHYYSVYSHLGQIKVKLQELVKKSQMIATAGSTTTTNSVGIYFEIRHFSEPENPKNWLAPRDVKVSARDFNSAPHLE
jgi:septal ring factor EnvC (AmiA/AmiB activator)